MFRPLAAVLHKSKHPKGIVSGESYILLTCSRRITMEIKQARANCKGSIPFPIFHVGKELIAERFLETSIDEILNQFSMNFPWPSR